MNEVELLFTEVLKCDRLFLCLNRDLRLDKIKSFLVSSALKRRLLGEPIQYILGKTEFMGLEFKVDKNVLIPRPQTEVLVEEIVKLVASRQSPVASPKILELGTGSGCIAISLAKLLPQVEICATDISSDALNIAKINARLNNVEDRIKFIQSNLFTDYRLPITDYDMIISNPPYIPTGDIDTLQPEIRYEPRIALDGGKDGVDFYHRIINDAPSYLKKNGFLALEMGFNQKEAVINIIQKSGNFEIIEVIKDYNNIDRVIVAQSVKCKAQSLG